MACGHMKGIRSDGSHMKSKCCKTIGILGGMGPAATCDLMMKIINKTAAERDQDHIPVLVDSNTMIPDRTDAILHRGEDPVPQLTASARRLEVAGADFLIMPCNTAHFFIDDIRRSVNVPVMSMLSETVSALAASGVKKAAILATDGTVQSGIYRKAFEAEGIEDIYPDDEQQKLIMSVVYEYIKRGITDPDLLPRKEMATMKDVLKNRGAEALVLACTELPMAFEYMGLCAADCIDPTEVLAIAAIRAAGAKVKDI